MRYLTGSIRNWPALLQQAYEHTSPGGWIEICDPVNPCISDDGTLTEDSALLKWNRLLVEGSNKLGASMEAIHNMKRWVEETGYVNVTKVEYKWPINGWPKDQHFKEVGMLFHPPTSHPKKNSFYPLIPSGRVLLLTREKASGPTKPSLPACRRSACSCSLRCWAGRSKRWRRSWWM
jgi:hypothetical protein